MGTLEGEGELTDPLAWYSCRTSLGSCRRGARPALRLRAGPPGNKSVTAQSFGAAGGMRATGTELSPPRCACKTSVQDTTQSRTPLLPLGGFLSRCSQFASRQRASGRHRRGAGPVSRLRARAKEKPRQSICHGPKFWSSGRDEGNRDRAVAHKMCVQDLSPSILHNPEPRCFH